MLVVAMPLQGPVATTPMGRHARALMPPRQLSRSRSESVKAGYGLSKGRRAITEEPYPTSGGRVVDDDAPVAALRQPVANGVLPIASGGGGGDEPPGGGP